MRTGIPIHELPTDFSAIDTIYDATTILRTIKIRYREDVLCEPVDKLRTVSRPVEVYEVLKWIFSGLDADQEHAVLLVLNRAMEITGYKLIASGGQAHISVDCKILFRNALLLGAGNIIFVHNHPSGNLLPSDQDLRITAKIVKAGELLDIPLVDHIIFTEKSFSSIRELHPSVFE